MPSTMRPRNLPLPAAYHPGFTPSASLVRNGLDYSTISTTLAMVKDEIVASPMMIPAGTRFDRVGVQAGLASGTVEIGLYASDPLAGAPTDLIKQFTSTALALVNGWAEITIDLTIHETALYWFAMQSSAIGTASPKRVQSGGLFKVIGSTSGDGLAWGYSKSGQVNGVLASTFPDSPSVLHEGFVCGFRVLEAPPPLTSLLHNNRPQVYWGLPGEEVGFADRIDDVGGSDFSVASDTIYVIPVFIQEAAHIDQVIVAFPSVDEVGNARNVIYDGNLDGYPRDLLFRGASVALTAGGSTDNVDFILQPGIYWVGLQTDGTGAGTTTSGRISDGYLQFSTSGPSDGTFYSHAGLKTSDGGAVGKQDPFPSGATGMTTAPNGTLRYSQHGQYLPSGSGRTPNVFTPWHIYHKGWYVGPVGNPRGAIDAKLGSDSQYRAISFTLDRSLTIDQVYYDIKAINGTYAFDLAIYEDIGYFPGDLLYAVQDTGISTVGHKTVSVTWPMQPGRYWFVVGNNGAGTSVDMFENQNIAYRNSVSGDDGSAAVDRLTGTTSLPNPWTGTGVNSTEWGAAGFRIGSYS